MYAVLEFNNKMVEGSYEILYISDPQLMLPSFDQCACNNEVDSI